MESGLKRTQRDYTLALKLSVVQQLKGALAERVNGILKTELLLLQPANLAQATRMVLKSVAIYNGEGPICR